MVNGDYAMNRLAIAALLCAGCINAPAPPTPPQPVVETVESAAFASMSDYRVRSADVFDALAADLRAGKYQTQAAFADAMEAATKDARHKAFTALREAWQADNPDDWDREADAVKCEETARGFRK